MSAYKIYLINTGNIQRENVICSHDSKRRIDISDELSDMIVKKKATLNPKITPGQMYNVISMKKEGGILYVDAGYTDYVEHVSHANVILDNREKIDPRFNALGIESVDKTNDGLIAILRRDVSLPHGPGIYDGVAGYGVHFRGRKIDGEFVPINRSDLYDVASFYVERELEVEQKDFNLEWLGTAKGYELSLDFVVNFLANLNLSHEDILRKRRETKTFEGITIDDMINFVSDTPNEILRLIDLIGVEKNKLPKDSVGMKYGENPLTERLGINDDFIAAILQYAKVHHKEHFSQMVDLVNTKGYEVIEIEMKDGEEIDIAKTIIP